jgi:hypothetical protein
MPRMVLANASPFIEPREQVRDQYGHWSANQQPCVLVQAQFKRPEVINPHGAEHGNHHIQKIRTHFLINSRLSLK